MKLTIARILFWIMLLLSSTNMPAFSAVLPEEWKVIRSDLHVNEKTLTRIDGNTVSVWLYLFPGKGSDTYHAARQQIEAMQKDGKDLEYIGHLSEIDCGQHLYRKIITVFFKEDRNIIASRHRLRADWMNLVNDDIFDDLHLAVCETHKMAIRSTTEKD